MVSRTEVPDLADLKSTNVPCFCTNFRDGTRFRAFVRLPSISVIRPRQLHACGSCPVPCQPHRNGSAVSPLRECRSARRDRSNVFVHCFRGCHDRFGRQPAERSNKCICTDTRLARAFDCIDRDRCRCHARSKDGNNALVLRVFGVSVKYRMPCHGALGVNRQRYGNRAGGKVRIRIDARCEQ